MMWMVWFQLIPDFAMLQRTKILKLLTYINLQSFIINKMFTLVLVAALDLVLGFTIPDEVYKNKIFQVTKLNIPWNFIYFIL